MDLRGVGLEGNAGPRASARSPPVRGRAMFGRVQHGGFSLWIIPGQQQLFLQAAMVANSWAALPCSGLFTQKTPCRLRCHPGPGVPPIPADRTPLAAPDIVVICGTNSRSRARITASRSSRSPRRQVGASPADNRHVSHHIFHRPVRQDLDQGLVNTSRISSVSSPEKIRLPGKVRGARPGPGLGSERRKRADSPSLAGQFPGRGKPEMPPR